MEIKKSILFIRPENCIISALGVLTGAIISSGSIELGTKQIMLAISAFAITGAGNTINDFYDQEVDKKLGKQKSDGKKTYWTSMGLFTMGIIIASFVNTHALIISSIASISLIIYAGAMQKMKYVGNWLVALLTATTIVYGATITKNYEAIILPALSAFFTNAAREIIKDAEDIKGDKGNKITLPMIVKTETIKKIVLMLYSIAIVAALIATALMKQQLIYIAGIIITSAILYESYKNLLEEKFSEARRFAKYAMATALITFIIGSL